MGKIGRCLNICWNSEFGKPGKGGGCLIRFNGLGRDGMGCCSKGG